MIGVTHKVKGKRVDLGVMADVQHGVADCDTEGFTRYMEYMSEQPYPRFVGVGDYVDLGSPSNRRLILASEEQGKVYDTMREAIDAQGKKHAAEFVEMAAPARGKTDVLVGGHHLWPYANHRDSTDTDIAKALGRGNQSVPYAAKEQAALVSYIFRNGLEISVYVKHGNSNSPLSAGREVIGNNLADIIIMGHSHKLMHMVEQRTVAVTEDGIDAQRVHLCGAGSWLESIRPGRSTYVERANLQPVSVGAPHIIITDDGCIEYRVPDVS